MRRLSLPIAVVALALAAGAARAEAPTPAMPDPAAAALNAAVLKASVPAPDRQPLARPPRGVAKTSVEARFAHDRAEGAIGFLCGRPDSLDERAASQPYGSDPQGKFLGARLAFAFR